eukprot:scaffold146748_cov32-Tisochrysis_lutea.AAC.7
MACDSPCRRAFLRWALAAALEELLALGALDSTGALTDNGRVMAKLPVEPMYAKAILVAGSGANHEAAADCVVGAGGYTSGPASSVQPGGELMLGHMLALVSMLCADGALFHAPANKKDAADEARNRCDRQYAIKGAAAIAYTRIDYALCHSSPLFLTAFALRTGTRSPRSLSSRRTRIRASVELLRMPSAAKPRAPIRTSAAPFRSLCARGAKGADGASRISSTGEPWRRPC